MMMRNDYYYHKGGPYWYSTGKRPAPPLPFVPLTSNVGTINQQLAAIRTITVMDTQHMDNNDLGLDEFSHHTLKAGLNHQADLAAAR